MRMEVSEAYHVSFVLSRSYYFVISTLSRPIDTWEMAIVSDTEPLAESEGNRHERVPQGGRT